jgi:hypothetical protein
MLPDMLEYTMKTFFPEAANYEAFFEEVVKNTA